MEFIKKHKLLFILSALIALLIILIVVNVLLDRGLLPGQPESSSEPRQINSQGDTILADTGEYKITYLPNFQKYLISINRSPFDTYRAAAEQAFIQVVGLEVAEACKLNVDIIVPRFVDELRAGRVYKLGFCTQPTPTPNLTLDPNLAPLSIEGVLPAEGIIESADTTNGVSITFSTLVDPTTVVVESSPSLDIRAVQHPVETNVINIIPQIPWQENQTYTLVIKAGARAHDNTKQLKEDRVLQYQVTRYVYPTLQPQEGRPRI